jgi:precorrin-3B synthase
MTARAIFFSRRRGACPGLSAPMQTGDGLLVRLQPTGIISLAAFIALCASARRDGNGIVEVTGRGSIQIRGLSVESAPQFADSVASLGIAATDGVSVLANPLAGIDPAEILDASAIAVDIRRAAADAGLGARLSPKVSVTVDGGGTLTLDDVATDVRLRAECADGEVGLRVSLGGDGAHATQLGTVAPTGSVEAVIRLLEMIAQYGRMARARDILAAGGTAPFRSAIADLLAAGVRPSTVRESCDVIDTHHLREGSSACGVGLPFGHAEAAALERLAASAATAGATGVGTAGRALLIVGVGERAMPEFVRDAERLGFIVDADDPRRRVIACSGAPICASGYVTTRALAPAIADSVAPSPHGTLIHVSGCAKGCAYSGKATLTVVGTPAGCALIAAGSVSNAPFAMVTAEDLPAVVARYVRESCSEDRYV